MTVKMGLFFIASVLWFLFFFYPFFSFLSITFLLCSSLPLSILPLLHSSCPGIWVSELQETLIHQIQLAILPGRKPKSRKLRFPIAGPSRRGIVRISVLLSCRAVAGPTCLVPSHYGFQPFSISALCSTLAHFSTMTSLLRVAILRQGTRLALDSGWKVLSKLFKPLEDVEKPTLSGFVDRSANLYFAELNMSIHYTL